MSAELSERTYLSISFPVINLSFLSIEWKLLLVWQVKINFLYKQLFFFPFFIIKKTHSKIFYVLSAILALKVSYEIALYMV